MKNIHEALHAFKIKQDKTNRIFKPQFFRLNEADDLENFKSLLKVSDLILTDEIGSQIKELVKIKNPGKKFSTEELESETNKHMGTSELVKYGVWIYYPWSKRLVHSLDETEFIAVRTSRNKYKITEDEQQILTTKKVGVIGLSVGQSVSLTMAMERGCGELRLADFDTLELTNLNRIRTGIHNLGLPKVYAVAREISEIDPFLKVICFEKGLYEENMDEFFIGNGKLDLLIEESDGFDIKILSRYKARELRIPVIMEGSDRCLVDVERFDFEPERSILHGLVDHLDISKLKELKTTEQKIPYMLDILGIDTSSVKLKASMLEIDQSINTWPQLASSVTMGGGITADVSRRIFLNQYTESGRYYVDVEELIGNKLNPKKEKQIRKEEPATDFKMLTKALNLQILPGQQSLAKDVIEKIVIAGSLAPSGGNSQPWRWTYHNNSLLLFNAFDANAIMLGYGNLSSYVGIGAAIENVVLCAQHLGFACNYELFPNNENPKLVSVFRFFKDDTLNPGQKRFAVIDTRLTNRKLGSRKMIDSAILNKLVNAAEEINGASLLIFTSEKEMDEIGELLGELEKIRLLEKTGHRDFVEEIRWTEKENEEKRDGVDLRTLDITNTELAGLKMAKDEKVIELINRWKGGGAFKKLTKKSIDAAGAVGVIVMNGSSKIDYINGGRAMQRVWLDATLYGIAFQPMASSVFLFARLLKGKGEDLSAEGVEKLRTLRPEFEKTLHIAKGLTEIFVFRLSVAEEPEIKSLRKPVDEIFSYF